MRTFPLGPQIQALRLSAQGANDMSYQDRKIKEILKDLELIDPIDTAYDDIFCGEDLKKLSKELNCRPCSTKLETPSRLMDLPRSVKPPLCDRPPLDGFSWLVSGMPPLQRPAFVLLFL